MREPTTDDLILENKILKYLILRKRFHGSIDLRYATVSVKSIYNSTVRYQYNISLQTVYTYLQKLAQMKMIDLIEKNKSNEIKYRANDKTYTLFENNKKMLEQERKIHLRRIAEIEDSI